jgi:hypothetical protein
MDRLSRIPELSVAPRTGAQNLLTGSVRREGDRLRVTAQLVNANGKQIWSQSFDRSPEDILAFQREVSGTIAATLSVAVSANGAPAFTFRGASIVAANVFIGVSMSLPCSAYVSLA